MQKGWIRHLDYIVIDLTALLISYFSARFFFQDLERYEFEYRNLGIMLVLLQFLVAFMTNAYWKILERGYLKEFYAVNKQILLVFSTLIVLMFMLQKNIMIPRKILFFIVVTDFILTYVMRTFWKKYLRGRYHKLKHTRQIFVITTRDEAEKMVEHLSREAIQNYHVSALAITDQDMAGEKIGGILVNTNKENLEKYAETLVVDEVLLNIPDDKEYEHRLAKEFLDAGMKINIYMQQNYENFPNRAVGVIFGYDVLTSNISKISFKECLVKRMMDIAGGIVGVFFAVLVGIVIAPIIYISSPGPVIYTQIRIGKGGRQFKLYKFRSMYMDADERKKELLAANEGSDLMFKIKDDPRIIKGIGKFIRNTSIDEMPQFWNVLKGDMSLVGTRPPTENEYENYQWHHKKRLSIKPGITGLWQISGRSDIKDFEQVVELDTQYIENYSLELDVKIMLKTVLVVLKGKGAS